MLGLVQNVVVTNQLTVRPNIQVVSWNALTGATSYKVYRNAVPYGTFTLLTTTSSLTYTDNTPTIPIGYWYYKVSAVDGSGEGSLPQYGITCEDWKTFINNPITVAPSYPTNSQMTFYFEEIRRRNLWMLENDGEDVKLYKRRFEGTRCPQWSSEEGSCAFPLKDPKCYGTGYIGGYYPSIVIKVRRIYAPKKLDVFDTGYRIAQEPRGWTVWIPFLNNEDALVTKDNQRFEISNVENFYWRGQTLHQEFDMTLLTVSHPIYYVSG